MTYYISNNPIKNWLSIYIYIDNSKPIYLRINDFKVCNGIADKKEWQKINK